MSVKNFKFVSPGVFINEIDNSFIPRTAPPIGPVVIGRARRGLAMTPIKVDSYSKFVEMFGDTVPGGGNSDVFRETNTVSPMYGGYGAKAFLRGAVAPVTFVRLLGEQTAIGQTSSDAAAQAGWKTTYVSASTNLDNTGGAWGLWAFKSGSRSDGTLCAQNILTASLAGIIYTMNGTPMLSGSIYGASGSSTVTTASINTLINANSGIFTIRMSNSAGTNNYSVSLSDANERYIRKQLNTNPQLVGTDGDGNTQNFYPSGARVNYFLGETFDQDLLDTGLATSTTLAGMIAPISLQSTTDGTDSPAYMKKAAHTEPRTSWIIGQDLKTATDFYPQNMQKLFRLIGRGHGEWLQNNVKISISNIRQSNNSTTDYGTFSVIIRDMRDTDNDVVILERFDECTLNPSSPNFVGRKIGDRYVTWDANEKRLREYGEYPNQSKFVYVQMNADVEAGALDAVTLPFGYFGPPKFADVALSGGVGNSSELKLKKGLMGCTNTYINFGSAPADGTIEMWGLPTGPAVANDAYAYTGSSSPFNYGCDLKGATKLLSLQMKCIFPEARIRVSASAGGLTDPRNAYFGMQTTRTSQSTIPVAGIGEIHRMWDNSWLDDPTAGTNQTGVKNYAYVMSLDDIISGSKGGYAYVSGSRQREESKTSSGSYKDLLDAGYNKFTLPLWGGTDGWDITKPDPAWNGGMSTSATEDNSYIYHTWARAMDSVSDPEAVDMNMLVAPGLTNNNLTEKAMDICSARGDAMALIDLPNVFLPSSEGQQSTRSTKASRLASTPTQAATALRDRKIDTSYGATFYPWVQTRDEGTGRLLWIPPSVAMMGVLASSEKKSQLWFAPAGFNRGGLTEGAAGIPILNVTQRLTSKERDLLYEASINPIASFPSTGIVVFGQKTLQERQSALDRINVRRLVIYLKKQISIISSKILFEQNVQATWNRFRSLVEPFLANVKTTFGITDYKLILDESTTTPDLIDQNIMYAKIMVKPARAIEFIAIDFVIASTGASFDD